MTAGPDTLSRSRRRLAVAAPSQLHDELLHRQHVGSRALPRPRHMRVELRPRRGGLRRDRITRIRKRAPPPVYHGLHHRQGRESVPHGRRQ